MWKQAIISSSLSVLAADLIILRNVFQPSPQKIGSLTLVIVVPNHIFETSGSFPFGAPPYSRRS